MNNPSTEQPATTYENNATRNGGACKNCGKSLIEHVQQRFCPPPAEPPASAQGVDLERLKSLLPQMPPHEGDFMNAEDVELLLAVPALLSLAQQSETVADDARISKAMLESYREMEETIDTGIRDMGLLFGYDTSEGEGNPLKSDIANVINCITLLKEDWTAAQAALSQREAEVAGLREACEVALDELIGCSAEYCPNTCSVGTKANEVVCTTCQARDRIKFLLLVFQPTASAGGETKGKEGV